MMGIGAVGVSGTSSVLVYRPVEAVPRVGPRRADPRNAPSLTDGDGKALFDTSSSLETLTQDRRALLSALRGDTRGISRFEQIFEALELEHREVEPEERLRALAALEGYLTASKGIAAE